VRIEPKPLIAAESPSLCRNQLYRKVTLRIMPFVFLAYVVNQIDRTNVSFAKLQFVTDLGLSEAAYGLGAGMFFVGYLLFEVPSNLILHRIGARKTMVRIMILWGLASMAMSLVTTATQLYVVRFLLGLAEAGFFPGMIYYLGLWYPSRRRGRITSLLVMGIPFAGIVSSPLSGWIMQFLHGAAGLKGWQWLFLIEGAPAVLLGFAAPGTRASSAQRPRRTSTTRARGGRDHRGGRRNSESTGQSRYRRQTQSYDAGQERSRRLDRNP